jgi:hypothetical protein
MLERREENRVTVGKQLERKHLKDSDLDEYLILKSIFRKLKFED